MNKFLRRSLLSIIALLLAAVPVLAQEQQQQPPNIDKIAGVYEFEMPDYGVVPVTVTVSEEKEVAISAMGAVPTKMSHIEGNLWELNSAEFGYITIGFVEDEDDSISAMTIDSYDFSFIAYKKKQ
jgi:hypothetical protein